MFSNMTHKSMIALTMIGGAHAAKAVLAAGLTAAAVGADGVAGNVTLGSGSDQNLIRRLAKEEGTIPETMMTPDYRYNGNVHNEYNVKWQGGSGSHTESGSTPSLSQPGSDHLVDVEPGVAKLPETSVRKDSRSQNSSWLDKAKKTYENVVQSGNTLSERRSKNGQAEDYLATDRRRDGSHFRHNAYKTAKSTPSPTPPPTVPTPPGFCKLKKGYSVRKAAACNTLKTESQCKGDGNITVGENARRTTLKPKDVCKWERNPEYYSDGNASSPGWGAAALTGTVAAYQAGLFDSINFSGWSNGEEAHSHNMKKTGTKKNE